MAFEWHRWLRIPLSNAYVRIGHALGLIFLPIIFYPILAFGTATYARAITQADPF